MRLAPLHWVFYGNTVRAWLIAAAVLLVVFGTLYLLKRFVINRYAARAVTSATRFDDALVEMLRRTRFFFILFMALSIAIRVLELPGELRTRVTQVAIAALYVQFGIWGVGLVSFWAAQFVEGGKQANPGSITAVTALSYVAKAAVWLLMMLLVLANFNINVTALVAGLGVTGIAVALAVQSVLGDLLGALSIVMARPFVVGETITVGELTGTVEYVGLRTTRIRSVNGEQFTVPNKQILENTIRNWTRMTERRVVAVLGVEYETPRATLAEVPRMLRESVEAQGEATRFGRAHLKAFGAYSVDFELAYWVRSPDYDVYMATQEAVNLDILRRFEESGVNFAYPTAREFQLEVRAPHPARTSARA